MIFTSPPLSETFIEQMVAALVVTIFLSAMAVVAALSAIHDELRGLRENSRERVADDVRRYAQQNDKVGLHDVLRVIRKGNG